MNDTSKAVSILVVEDEEKLRNLLQGFLKRSGFNVEMAEDAKEMDKHMQQNAFDLLIVDLMLPGESGFSITKRVHDQLNIPIIILSAMADEESRVTGLEMGAEDYITKPFNPKELLERVYSVLHKVGDPLAG